MDLTVRHTTTNPITGKPIEEPGHPKPEDQQATIPASRVAALVSDLIGSHCLDRNQLHSLLQYIKSLLSPEDPPPSIGYPP